MDSGKSFYNQKSMQGIRNRIKSVSSNEWYFTWDLKRGEKIRKARENNEGVFEWGVKIIKRKEFGSPKC